MAEKKIKAVLEIGGSIGSSLKSSFATITGNTKKLGASLKGLRDESKRLKQEMKSGLGGPEARAALAKLDAQIERTKRNIGALNKIKGLGLGGKFGAVGSSAAIGFGVVAAQAVAAGAAIMHLADSTAKYADDAGEAAQKLGMNANALIELKYAADDVGTGAESLEKSMAKMQATLEKSRGKPPQVFKLLRLDVAKLSRQKPEEQLNAIAEAFKNYKGKVSKTAIAMAIFGKSGKEMVPLLELGKEGLKEYAEEAEQLGLTLSDKTLKAGDEFQHQHLRIQAVMTGLRNTIGAELMPVVEEFSHALLKFAKDNRGQIQAWAQQLGQTLVKEVPQLIQKTSDLIAKINEFAKSAWSVIEPLGGVNFLLGALVVIPFLPTVAAIGSLAAALVSLGVALGGVTIAGAPLLLVIGAVAAVVVSLGVAVWQVYKNWDKWVAEFSMARKWMLDQWEEYKTAAEEFGATIYDKVAGAFDSLKLKAGEWFNWVKTKFAEFGSAVGNVFSFGGKPAESNSTPQVSGQRALGGSVSAGRSYLVGERGPEIFSPSTGGNIRANGAGVTDNRSYVINVHAAPGMDERTLADLVMARLAGRQAALAGGALYD